MRPLKLIMQAFGPYAGVQEIDFSSALRHGLFLVHGPTGAGKTAILDAMSFALYGDTSGGERRGEDMRSHHADPALSTRVIFEFALGNDFYRVLRSPRQMRPKKRGEGMTQMDPEAALWRIDPATGEETALATRPTEVNERLEALIGFGAEQFRQVVMLPQGLFRRFLVAGSADRQKILASLFRTGRFRALEEALKAAAAKAEERLADMRTRREEILAAAGVEEIRALEERTATTRAWLHSLEAEKRRLQGRNRQVERAIALAEERQRLLGERDAAKRHLADLEARRNEMEAARLRLDLARRANTLRDVADEERRRRRELREAGEALGTARAADAEAAKAQALARERLETEKARDGRRRQLSDEMVRLSDLAKRISRLEIMRKSADALRRKRDEAAMTCGSLEKAIQEIATRLEKGEESRISLADLAASAAGLRARHDALTNALEAARALVRCEMEETRILKDLGEARARVSAAKERFEAARLALQKTEEAWKEGHAALLARELRPGAPCPVCGSTDHPAPARPASGLVDDAALQKSRSALRKAEEDLRNAEKDLSTGEAEHARLKGRMEALRNSLRAAPSFVPEELEAMLSSVSAELRKAAGAVTQLERIDAAITELKTKREELAVAMKDAEGERSLLERQLAETQGALRQAEDDLPPDLRSENALHATLKRLKTEAEELENALKEAEAGARQAEQAAAAARSRLEAAGTSLENARRRHAEVLERFRKRLREAGFETEGELSAAMLADDALAKLQRLTERHAADLQAAKERLSKAETAAEGVSAPDLAALSRARDSLSAAHDELARRIGEVSARLEQLENAGDRLERLRARFAQEEERHAALARLAEVAGGTRNPGRMSFERFVLATLFDDVLSAANRRLDLMSRGRFLLRRQKEQRDGRMSGGLDLEVFDTHTGRERPVRTLSGGESFLAALSLALGLADVVQAHAGGIRLETMFIDEGFGSLDAEALDLAIRALMDLRGEGRLIGIISHVGELRERIDLRLEVRPGADGNGSSARFSTG